MEYPPKCGRLKQQNRKSYGMPKGNKAKGKGMEAREINLALDNIKAQIIKHYQRIPDYEAYVTAYCSAAFEQRVII